MTPIICPTCKGSGTRFNADSLLLTVALPIAMLIDCGKKEGITKRECENCNGDGFLGGGLEIHSSNRHNVKTIRDQFSYAQGFQI